MIEALREDIKFAWDCSDRDLEDGVNVVVLMVNTGEIQDDPYYDGTGPIPHIREYLMRASMLNVLNTARALRTRAMYLEILSKTIPGRMATTSVNCCMGKYLSDILEMDAGYDKSEEEIKSFRYLCTSMGRTTSMCGFAPITTR